MKRNHIIFVLLLLAGCQSKDIRPKGTGTEYFPLKVGGFWIYDNVQTSITQLGGQTTVISEIRIQITDSVNSAGEVNYRLQRSQRLTPSAEWMAIETWSARKDEFRAILQQGNISYLKLSFPLTEGKTWNGNVLNTLGGPDICEDGTAHCENYKATDLRKQFDGAGGPYEDSVTIYENNDNDPIVKQDVRKSVYAKSVGLVYHEETILEYCTVGDCIGKQIVEIGTVVKQTLKSYGGL